MSSSNTWFLVSTDGPIQYEAYGGSIIVSLTDNYVKSLSKMVCILFSFFVLSYYVSLRSEFHVVMFGSSLPPVFCRRTYVLFTLFVFVCVLKYVMSNPYCVVFLFFCFFFRLVYPMFPVSLDCLILIAPLVSSNVIAFVCQWQTGHSARVSQCVR